MFYLKLSLIFLLNNIVYQSDNKEMSIELPEKWFLITNTSENLNYKNCLHTDLIISKDAPDSEVMIDYRTGVWITKDSNVKEENTNTIETEEGQNRILEKKKKTVEDWHTYYTDFLLKDDGKEL